MCAISHETRVLTLMDWNMQTSCHLVGRGPTTHTGSSSRFHSSFNSSEMSHQPVTCCAGSKQE